VLLPSECLFLYRLIPGTFGYNLVYASRRDLIWNIPVLHSGVHSLSVYIFNCLFVSGTEVGTLLTAVTANDVDTNPALTYGFSGDSDAEVGSIGAEASGLGVFSIGRFSGKVTLIRRLDFESRREYRLRVTASDTAHTTRTVLTIRVTDVNDNPPIFMQPSYQASLPGEYRIVLILGCTQKFPVWVDKETYASNNKHSLRSNTNGYGVKTH
jgi:hypothetical protein